MQIELFTRESCQACTQTKRALQEFNLSWIEHRIGEDITREDLVAKYPNASKLPVVVVDGNYVGSREDLFTMIHNANGGLSAGQRSNE